MPQAERSGRRYGLDVLRALSMLMVVAVHSLEVLDYSRPWSMLVNAIGLATFFPANAFFFMLSGKLNLRVLNQGQIPRFYLRKVRNILIPTLIFFALNTVYDLWPDFGSALHVGKVFVLNALGGYRHIHYWFVFQLFGFFLATPFLARTFEGLHRRRTEWRAFVALGLLFTTAAYLSPNIGVELNWHYPFSMFLFAYCLGPSLAPNEEISSKTRLWCAIGAVVGWAGMVGFMLMGWSTGLHDVSPFYTLFGMCAFTLLVDACSRMKPRRIVEVLAGNSFGVYLCHMMVMRIVERFVPLMEGKMSLLSVGGVWAATVVISLVVSIVVNAVLVNPLELLFDRIVRVLGWGPKPHGAHMAEASEHKARGQRKKRKATQRGSEAVALPVPSEKAGAQEKAAAERDSAETAKDAKTDAEQTEAKPKDKVKAKAKAKSKAKAKAVKQNSTPAPDPPADEYDLSEEFEPERSRQHLVLIVPNGDSSAAKVRDFAEGHAIELHEREGDGELRLEAADETVEGAEAIVTWLRDNMVDA